MNFSTFSVGGCWGQSMSFFFENWLMKHKCTNLPKPIGTINQWNYWFFYPSELIYFALFNMRHPVVYLIKNSPLFNFLPKKWWSCDYFFFPASEAPKNFWGPQKRLKFWILDLKVCLKKLSIGPGLYIWKKCPVSNGRPWANK